MFKYVVMVCSMVCLLSATPLWAGKVLVGNFTYAGFGDNLRVVVKSDTSFRIDILEGGASEDVFMLMDGNKRWLVGRDDNESAWEAVDFGELATFLSGFSNVLPDTPQKAVITKAEKQTVAGIAGESYFAKYDDETFDLILTQNADIVTLTKAVFLFFKDIDDDEVKSVVTIVTQINDENKKAYGLLKFADNYVFTGLEHQDYPDSYFALPEDVKFLDLENMFDE